MKKLHLINAFGVYILMLGLLPNAYSAQIVSMGNFLGCCNAVDMSANGQIVVGSFEAIQTSTPMYWTPSQGLVTISGRRGIFNSISRDGSTMAGTGLATDNFKYSAVAGYVDLPDTNGQTAVLGLGPQGVSDDGSFVAGVQQGGRNALVWDASGTPTLLSNNGRTYDISGDASVVVGRSGAQAARWVFNSGVGPTTLELLGTLGGGTSSDAQTVSQDGSIIFGQAATSTGAAHAFRWIDGIGIEDINAGFNNTDIWAVTANGAIAAGSADGKAAIWDASNGWQTIEDLLLAAGIINYDLTNLQMASAISSDGRYIVANAGSGATREGFWIDLGAPLTTVPVPASVWLFGSGLLGLLGVSRRKKAA